MHPLRFFILLLLIVPSSQADDKIEPPNIQPFEIPTFTGKNPDWEHPKGSLNPLPVIDSDAIFKTVNRCYPLKSGFGLDIALKVGATYRATDNSTQINTLDSNKYYAGIVANMPLYSDTEIDRERKMELQRRLQTTEAIKSLLSALATKRKSERMIGLYQALEKRAQSRVKIGVTDQKEQIEFLEKVAAAQGELDIANATIEASRLALIGQCRPETEEQVNNYILSQIGRLK